MLSQENPGGLVCSSPVDWWLISSPHGGSSPARAHSSVSPPESQSKLINRVIQQLLAVLYKFCPWCSGIRWSGRVLLCLRARLVWVGRCPALLEGPSSGLDPPGLITILSGDERWPSRGALSLAPLRREERRDGMEDVTKAADGECKSSRSKRRKAPMADPPHPLFPQTKHDLIG